MNLGIPLPGRRERANAVARRLSVLRALAAWHDLMRADPCAGFAFPSDIGGTNGSHHYLTLRACVKLGTVEQARLHDKSVSLGNPMRYRITDAGRAELTQVPADG